jgi:hypothetical protein
MEMEGGREMTNEQINIAIAEACGWEKVEGEECFFDNGIEQIYIENIPDYCNDLNAMHEAEKVLNDEQWPEYREELRNVVLGGIRMVSQWCKADLHATARQRAEAFLKTLGKWEE